MALCWAAGIPLRRPHTDRCKTWRVDGTLEESSPTGAWHSYDCDHRCRTQSLGVSVASIAIHIHCLLAFFCTKLLISSASTSRRCMSTLGCREQARRGDDLAAPQCIGPESPRATSVQHPRHGKYPAMKSVPPASAQSAPVSHPRCDMAPSTAQTGVGMSCIDAAVCHYGYGHSS